MRLQPPKVPVSQSARMRRRLRFGMRSLLAIVTLACIILALVAHPMAEARRQQELVSQVAALGGRISVLGSIPREPSPGKFILAHFDSSYGRYPLYRLDFSGAKVTDYDLALLSRIDHIKELSLSGAQISDSGLRHLRNLKFLTKLDLGATNVTDRGLTNLKDLEVLASLNVMGTSVTYDALQFLDAALPYAHFCEERAIDELKAAGIQVTDPKRFVEGESSRGCGVVEAGRVASVVVVGMNPPISLTARDIINLGHLQSLPQMTFHSATLGPEGLTALRRLNELKRLCFWYVNLSDKDLDVLARQTQLESLTIHGCDEISEAALAALREQLPNCEIEWSIH